MGRIKVEIDQRPEIVVVERSVEWRISGADSAKKLVGGGIGVYASGGAPQVNRVLPEPDVLSGDDINGLQKNPVRTSVDEGGYKQGVDEQVRDYDPSLNLKTPVLLTENDILMKGVGLDYTETNDRRGQISDYSSLFVFETAPGDDLAAPSTLSWPGRGSLTPYDCDIPALVASLPSYPATGQSFPTHQSLVDKLKYWSPLTAFDTPLTNFYQSGTPALWNIVEDNSNYGGYLLRTFSPAYLSLISDAFTTAQKEEMAAILCGHGFQMIEMLNRFNSIRGINGGHLQFFQGCVALAETAAGIDTSDFVARTRNCFEQAFVMPQDLLDKCVPHTNTAWPYPYRERALTAVNTSQNEATIFTDNGGSIFKDPAQIIFVDMNMIRKSDGAQALVTGRSSVLSDEVITLTLDGQPPEGDWAVDDIVTFDLPGGIDSFVSLGDYEWSNFGLVRLHGYNPVANAAYRAQNKWTAQACLLKSLGVTGDIDPVYGYVQRANDPANNLPDHHFVAVEEAFWDTNGATIFP